jgi:hypothetical protein
MSLSTTTETLRPTEERREEIDDALGSAVRHLEVMAAELRANREAHENGQPTERTSMEDVGRLLLIVRRAKLDHGAMGRELEKLEAALDALDHLVPERGES